jgi:hypothetical protein
VPSTLTNVAVFDVSRLPRGLLATYGGGGTPTTRLGSRRRRRVALRDSGGLQGVRLRPADQLLGRTSEGRAAPGMPGEHRAPRRLRRDGQSVGVENERALPGRTSASAFMQTGRLPGWPQPPALDDHGASADARSEPVRSCIREKAAAMRCLPVSMPSSGAAMGSQARRATLAFAWMRSSPPTPWDACSGRDASVIDGHPLTIAMRGGCCVKAVTEALPRKRFGCGRGGWNPAGRWLVRSGRFRPLAARWCACRA